MKKIIVLVIALMGSGIELHAMRNPKEELNKTLSRAVRDGNVNLVQQLLSQGADPNTRDYFNNLAQTVLMVAVDDLDPKGTRLQIAQALLDAGADPDLRDYIGQTALFYAAASANAAICKLLLDRGANPNAIKKHDKFPALYTLGKHPIEVRGLHPSFNQFKQTLIILASAIPTDQQEMIRREMAGLLGMRGAAPRLPRDMRNLITQDLINKLVDDQMARIQQLLSTKRIKHSLKDTAFRYGREQVNEIKQIIKFNDPQSLIRKQAENNIRRILFEKPAPNAQQSRL